MYPNTVLDLITKSPTAFHAVSQMKAELDKNGYVEIKENEKFDIKVRKFYVARNNSSIIAINLGESFDAFNIVASHTDSPTFKLKPNFEIISKQCTKLNTEEYGGFLDATWFDRPLSIAGRAFIQDEGIKEVLVDIEKDLLVIPSLAIHMNRGANTNATYNPQIDMQPIAGSNSIKEELVNQLHTSEENLLGFDLFLYNRTRGSLWGKNREMISAPQLDNLECAFTSLLAFLEAKPKVINVFASFDNEEIGSRTRQAADSTFLYDVLRRISLMLARNEEEFMMMLANSFMISADNAHAIHPNYIGKYDETNHAFMNKGVVIKYNAKSAYTTDGYSEAVLKSIFKKANLPYQVFTNRSDMIGGSTLGAISLSHVSIPCVDIGLPILAMHSSYETGGANDLNDMIALLRVFYESKIVIEKERTKIE